MYQQTKHTERKHFCMNCLQCFSSENVLHKHREHMDAHPMMKNHTLRLIKSIQIVDMAIK